MVVIADELLCAKVPVAGQSTQRAAVAMEIIATDPAIVRVDQLSARTGATPRTLQRLFAEHVGTGPQVEPGYTDQAHFTRDFTTIAGISPARYHLLGASIQCSKTLR
jgi:AraC-like DNA-binding protein